MTPRSFKCKEIWPLQSSSKFSGVPEDSNFPFLGVWASPSYLAQRAKWGCDILDNVFAINPLSTHDLGICFCFHTNGLGNFFYELVMSCQLGKPFSQGGKCFNCHLLWSMNIFHKVSQDYNELRDVCSSLIIFRYFVGMLVIFLFYLFILIFWLWIQRRWFCVFSLGLKFFKRFHSLFSSSFNIQFSYMYQFIYLIN
jgi:hypothetical protein